MALTRVPLLTSSSGGAPVSASPERVYNLFPSITASKAQGGVVWKNTPGWNEWSVPSLSGISVEAPIIFKNVLYVVNPNNLYSVDLAGSATAVGALTGSGNILHTAEDGINLIITTGEEMWRWDGSTFAAVTLPAALTNPTGVIFHDGHFVCYNEGTGEFWISNKFDGSTWDALDFATAEDKPDKITGLLSDRVLWIFGEYTTQAYYNSGESFPFKPNPQGLLIYGMVGETQAQLDNTAFWLARSKNGNLKAVKANGYAPQAISNAQLEQEWSGFKVTNDAYANTLMWQGHEWYVLTFPTEGRTFVFDTQGAWFEWGEYDDSTDTIVAHPMLDFIYYNGWHLFTDTNAKIQRLQESVYNHDGKVMQSGFKSHILQLDGERLFLNNVIMDMRTGVDADAVMELRVSHDGGKTFTSWDSRDLGAEGDYKTRVEWHRLGSGYDVVIQGRITSEVPREIISGIVGVKTQMSYLDRRNQRSGVYVE